MLLSVLFNGFICVVRIILSKKYIRCDHLPPRSIKEERVAAGSAPILVVICGRVGMENRRVREL